ncbi:MAG: hypothetical protein H6814_04750 [Phycisphaeraceae bacterium]|nr:hypothetical protein [Phycisphaeraceae bacterium]
MARTTLRWIMIAIAVLLVGPIAAWLCRPMTGADGGLAATMLVTSETGPAIMRTLLAFALVAVFGAGVSVLMGWRLGSFVAGVALAWPAWEHAGVAQLIRETADSSIIVRLAIEGAILMSAALAVSMCCYRLDRGIDRKPGALAGAVPGIGGHIAAALAAGTLAGILALVIAIGEHRSQAFAAGVVAAIAAGCVARFIGPSQGPFAGMLGLLLTALAAPLLTRMMAGADLVESAYVGSMLNLGHLTPMLWASGALVGVPIGTAWAESMFEKQAPQSATA